MGKQRRQGQPKRRSGEAVAAMHRNAGVMRHRLQPKGGTRNDQAELVDEFDLNRIEADHEQNRTEADYEQYGYEA